MTQNVDSTTSSNIESKNDLNPEFNGFSIAALVMGIIWLFWVGSFFAIVFGSVAIYQIRRSGKAQRGAGFAIAGVILGLVGMLLLAFAIIFGLAIAGLDFENEPSKLEITSRTTFVDSEKTTNPDGTYAAQPGADGAYSVKSGPDTVGGFRIDEKFGPLAHTAVVRSSSVTGAFTISGTKISGVTISIDTTKLTSIDEQPPGVFPVANRISFLEDDGLETKKFPTAMFASTSITLPSAPVKGAAVKVTANGKLTIHGVTKDVAIPLTATWNGEIIDVLGELPIVLADFGITPPSLPFVKVVDTGTLEFKAALTKK